MTFAQENRMREIRTLPDFIGFRPFTRSRLERQDDRIGIGFARFAKLNGESVTVKIWPDGFCLMLAE